MILRTLAITEVPLTNLRINQNNDYTSRVEPHVCDVNYHHNNSNYNDKANSNLLSVVQLTHKLTSCRISSFSLI
jgi:hypothetical protein